MAEGRARCAGPWPYGTSTLAPMSGYAVAHLDWEDSDFDPIRDEPAFEELVGRD